jgi:hypothetical protein
MASKDVPSSFLENANGAALRKSCRVRVCVPISINIRLSFFNRDWFNSIQNKDSAAFWSLLFGVFCFWAAIARLDQGQSQGGGSVHLTVAE